MSQNDMSIANASGATVRADINSALQALASQNSGSSAPSTTYANQWWHDDTNDIMKIRDEANANWINAFSKVGTTWIPYSSGSVLGTMANLNYASITQHLTMGADKALAFDETSVSSGTPNFASSGNVVILSGTATADTLGTVQAGFVGIIYYGIAITLTHNATSRKLPTAADIDTSVGDFEIVLSRGSGNWYTVLYMRADGTALVGSSASQAQMEAASSTAVFVTPGRQQFHPGHLKAWVHYKMTTTSAIQSDYGITSRTDDGTGQATFTFDTAFSSTAAYSAVGGWSRDDANDSNINSSNASSTKTTTTFKIVCTNNAGGSEDSPEVGNAWGGDQ